MNDLIATASGNGDNFIDVWDMVWFGIGLCCGWFFIPTPRAIMKRIKGRT